MVRIRLMRMGAIKRPFYRVVVADSRSPRDGRFIENIGKYHPLGDPSIIEIDEDRALYWLSQGAQPSGQVVHLLRIQGIWGRFEDTKKAPKSGDRPRSAKAIDPASTTEGGEEAAEETGPRTRGTKRPSSSGSSA
jgi:small subunit ribosomal protein S16